MRDVENGALDNLLNHDVRVYVMPRGIYLAGKLSGHDDTSVVLDDGCGKTVVYKTKIISVTEDDEHE